MLRHGSYPNWPWTFVDDYPMLGELLMLPLYALKPALARLAPILAYAGCGVFTGLIAAEWAEGATALSRRAVILLGIAWALGLRALAVQSNLLMVDNLASCFVLGEVYFLIVGRRSWAGAFGGLALATRYSAWPVIAVLSLIALFVIRRREGFRYRDWIAFLAWTASGALPFVVRNLLVNGNPVFPLCTAIFGPRGLRTYFDHDPYGAGTSLGSLFKLPWRLLYTNEFVTTLFDYRVGDVFLLQLAAALLAFGFGWSAKRRWHGSTGWVLAFVALDTLSWFYSAQQLRFLVPVLLLVQALALAIAIRELRGPVATVVLTCLTVASLLSGVSDHRREVSILLGDEPIIFQAALEKARPCMELLAANHAGAVAYMDREGSLGFFDQDFAFIGKHPYAIAMPGIPKTWPDFLYDPSDAVGVSSSWGYRYLAWPGACAHVYVRPRALARK